ncbi:toxin glutamine deamidase domain-containing protein [Kitasatospora cineracea]|uniref:toxin glutamine deamidase domain-containing protein n=1 Tax=Kitasatospora cineracea TaxID=88074 RepID=UPI00341CE605
MLPDSVEWVLEMLGFDWPTADEDKLMESAQVWRDFADQVEELHYRAAGAANNVLASNAGDSIDAFGKTWEKFSNGGSGYLSDAAMAARLIAAAFDAAAVIVITCKVAVIAQLVALAVELIAAQAAAPFTLGLSELGAAGATLATKAIVRRLLKELRKALVEAIMETLKEPVVSAVQAMISDLIAQTVNQGFGAQSGYDLGRTGKAGAEEFKDAVKNSGQTFTEALRDGAGARAGGHARSGLDHAAGRGGDSDPSGGGGSNGGGNSADASASASGGTGSTSGSAGSASGSGGTASGSGGTVSGGGGTASGDSSPSSSSSASSAPSGGTPTGSSPASGTSTGGGPTTSASAGSGPSGSGPSGDGPSGDGPSGQSASGPGGESPRSQQQPQPQPTATPASDPRSNTPLDPFGTRLTPDADSTPAADGPAPHSTPADANSASPDGRSTPDSSHPSSSPAPNSDTGTNTGPRPDADTTRPAATPAEGGAPPRTPDSDPSHTPDGDPSRPAPAPTDSTPNHTPDHAPGTHPIASDSPQNHTPNDDPTRTDPVPSHTPGGDSTRPDSIPPHTPDGESTRPTPPPTDHAPGAHPAPGEGNPPPHAAETAPAAGPAHASERPHSGDVPTPRDESAPAGTRPDAATPGPRTAEHATTPAPAPASTPTPAHASPEAGPARVDPRAAFAGTADHTGTPDHTGTASDDGTAGARPVSLNTAGLGATATAPPPHAGPDPRLVQTPMPSPDQGAPTGTLVGTPVAPGAVPTGATPGGSTPAATPTGNRPTAPTPTPAVPHQNAPAQNAPTPRPEQPNRNSTLGPRPAADRGPGTSRPDAPPHQEPAAAAHTPRPEPDSTAQNNPPQNGPERNGSDSRTTPDDSTPAADHPAAATERPLSDSRPYDAPGGLDRVDPQHQQDLESRIPRNSDGTPQRHPDPNGDWPGAVNGDGHRAPGRDNNCLDVALSTADTYSGNPTAAAPRNDSGPDGEQGGRDRAERQLGAPFRDLGNGEQAFRRIEDQLRAAGHGSQAVIVTQDANGRAHAWNAVNHDGRITYLDNQTGQRGDKPLHDGDHGVFAVPLDPDRRPLPADHPTGNDRVTENSRPDPGDTDRRPADPAGKGKPDPNPSGEADGKQKSDDGKPHQSLAEKHQDDPDHPAHEPARTEHERLTPREKPGDSVYGILGDQVQQDLRGDSEVRRVEMEYVYDQLHEWADSGHLGAALDRATGDNPMTLRRSDLEQALPGFGDMHPGEQGAVVASMGRMSSSFHEQHGRGKSPEEKPYPYSANPDQPGSGPGQAETESRGAVDHGKTKSDGGLKLAQDSEAIKKEIKKVFGVSKFEDAFDQAVHRPDFTGKNYAVLEVYDPTTKEVSYVLESSVPSGGDRAGITPLHSETHAGHWMENLNRGRDEKDRYEVLSLYTEREPCGRGAGHANCSGYLSESHEGVPVYYATGYRKGQKVESPEVQDTSPDTSQDKPKGKSKGKLTPRQHMNRDFGDHVGEVARIWLVTEQQRLP